MKRVDVICMIIIVKHGQIVFSFQIPKYILALHELLAHTPYEHVERRKLEYAKGKLEELSMVWFNIYMTSLFGDLRASHAIDLISLTFIIPAEDGSWFAQTIRFCVLLVGNKIFSKMVLAI